ncbi:odorant receptor 88a-like [Scaptodrosophila lebanonensis]|uniref:Odorant receptor n=1 Tax=Drosophila lebanonensis TaxID=7225 RepID=A0A6J2TGT2_DROLE|nr:odorant receptor 88a-like [Scaptodrosophila lebanonensis]
MDEQLIVFEQFLLPQKVLQYSGLVYFKFQRRNGRLTSNCASAFYVSIILVSIYYVFNCFDLVYSTWVGKPSSQNIAILCLTTYLCIRGLTLFFKHDDILTLFNDLDRIYPRDMATQAAMEVSKVYKQHVQRHNIIHYFSFTTLAMFCVMPVVLYIFDNERTGIITLEQQIVGGWFPFGIRQSHAAYPLVCLYDFKDAFVGLTFFATFDAIFNTIQENIIMHLDDLNRQVRALNASDSNSTSCDEFFEHIRSLVRRHQHLRKLCHKFNDFCKMCILLTDFVSALALCFHLVMLTETHNLMMIIKYLLPTLGLVLFTFDQCWRGTQLEQASLKFQQALFAHNWYMGSKKYRKFIILWLTQSQRTMKISAYGLIDVNMVHFTDIMQLAYKLLAFLKSR